VLDGKEGEMAELPVGMGRDEQVFDNSVGSMS
jgi:hypothetical protein